MFKRIAKFYMSKNRRERVMIAVIIWAIALIWFSELSDNNADLNTQILALESRRDSYKNVIAQADNIHKILEKIRSVFDPQKTIKSADLQLIVESCAKSAGLTYSMSAANTKPADKFDLHTINLYAQNAAISHLANFERELRKREPYITVQRVSFDGSKDGTIDARDSVASFSSKE